MMNNIPKLVTFGGRMKRSEVLSAYVPVVNSAKYSSDDVRFLKRTDSGSLKRGRGGRSSFSGVVATIFGASGFMGKYICNRLGKTGTQLIIPYRGDFHAIRRLKLLGDLGQVLFHPYHLCDEESIRKAVKYSNVVINLVGRDYESRNFNFHETHVDGARRIAKISKEAGVEKFIHISALNSDRSHPGYIREGGSMFLRTKGESEDAVREFFPESIIFRPSDIFGQQDRFLFYFNRAFRYADRKIPIPYNGVGIWKQPVYVGDVAIGIVNSVFDHSAIGKTFDAVGPRRYELCELIDWFLRVTRKDERYRRQDLKWSPMTVFKAKLNEFSLSNPINNFIIDKIEREAVTDKTFGLPNLEDLGVNLTKMEDRIAWELKLFMDRGYYAEQVGEFETPEPPKFIDASAY